MIVTFCGTSKFVSSDEMKKEVLSILEKEIKDNTVLFYLGGYGGFDGFARVVCREYQKSHAESKLIFVTPYLDEKYLKSRAENLKYYDEVLYADLENVPKRLAIIRRNFWMVDKADLIIGCVGAGCGGSAITYDYALQRKKKCINIFDKYVDCLNIL